MKFGDQSTFGIELVRFSQWGEDNCEGRIFIGNKQVNYDETFLLRSSLPGLIFAATMQFQNLGDDEDMQNEIVSRYRLFDFIEDIGPRHTFSRLLQLEEPNTDSFRSYVCERNGNYSIAGLRWVEGNRRDYFFVPSVSFVEITTVIRDSTTWLLEQLIVDESIERVLGHGGKQWAANLLITGNQNTGNL